MQTTRDELIGLAEAARLCGRTGRRGVGVHPATLTRWILRGVALRDGSRVRLRAVRVGQKWATRHEWVEEFIAATTAATIPADAEPSVRSPEQRDRDADAALAELRRMGVGAAPSPN
jgi:hypothetical protein